MKKRQQMTIWEGRRARLPGVTGVVSGNSHATKTSHSVFSA